MTTTSAPFLIVGTEKPDFASRGNARAVGSGAPRPPAGGIAFPPVGRPVFAVGGRLTAPARVLQRSSSDPGLPGTGSLYLESPSRHVRPHAKYHGHPGRHGREARRGP